MMSTLQDWYAGDMALEFVLVVALGVALLSTVAWAVSRYLARHPAARHLVLLSALLGCLAMPALAALSAGWFPLISIPILPAEPPRVNREPMLARTTAGSMSQRPARDLLWTESEGPGEPAGFSRFNLAKMAGEEPRKSAKPIAAIMQPTPEQSGPDRQHAVHPASWTWSYRGIATLVQIVWVCGSLVLILRFARSCLLVRQLRRSSRLLVDASLHRVLDDISLALGDRHTPRVLASPRLTTPVAVGFLRPSVILPERLIGEVSDDELRDVLLHEAAHVARRDTLVVLVQELARALYWPIVSVHAMIRELARAREELCDNYVLQHRDAVSYGQTLLHLAELSLNARPLGAVVGILHWRGELERRIAGLLEEGRSTMTRSNRWLVCFVALLFILGGAMASSTRFIARGNVNKNDSAQVQEPKEATPKAAAEAKPEPNPKRSLLIHVLGPDGQPMAGVKVHRGIWTRKDFKDLNRNYVSDDLGQVRMELPEGIYIFRLWARARGFVPLFAHWEEEEKPEESLPAEFTFRLQKGTSIGGVVHNQDGQPIKGVSVDVKLQSGGQRDGRTGPDGWLSEGETPVTDAEGRWTLDNVPASLNLDLRLKLSHPDYISDANWGASQEAQGVDLKALRRREATIIMRGGLVARGTVTDPQGKPIAGAVVVRGDDPYFEVGSQEVRTDDQGRYQFPPLPAGAINITVMAPGWMPAIRKVEIKQGMPSFDFRLEPGKELRIRFVDTAGKPVPGVLVMIDKWRGGESLYNHRHPNVLDTHIPVQADQDGLYRWTWAPDDPVAYVFEKEGFVRHEVTLSARDGEQTITLPRILKITGKVTDAATGRPILSGTAIPVLEFRPGRLITERDHLRTFSDGTYTIEGDRSDVSYRVRLEAAGYRSAISEAVRPGAPRTTLDFRLEAAPAVEGRILDPHGNPVKDARVYLATSTQILMNWEDDNGGGSGHKVVTGADGRFSFPAQFERYAMVAVHDSGYAEVQQGPDQQPGELTLKDWAHVDGRLLQAGQPVAATWITFSPLRILNGVAPHIQDSMSVKTDRDGRFAFRRVPPVKASVRAQLSVWQDSPLTSSQSVPLDLKPGEHVALDPGGKGTVVRGRVLLSGDAALKIDVHKSLNWLLRKAPGIEPPAELRSAGLTARDGWNNVWTSTAEGLAFMQTLPLTFVTLDKDGRFTISGVQAGDYDLALRLYEPPGDGCLVNPVGSRIYRFQVSEDAARGASMDLGEIPVKVALGPRTGDMVPDFAFADSSGKTRKLSALRGQYVLLDFWATWCAPCVAEFPALAKVHDPLGRNNRLTVLGVNLDDDPGKAQMFVERQKLAWTQAFLGRVEDKDEILSRYAISSVPTYILVGPDGKLIGRSEDLQVITEALQRVLP